MMLAMIMIIRHHHITMPVYQFDSFHLFMHHALVVP